MFTDPAKGLLRPSGTLQSGMRIGPGHMRHTVHTRKINGAPYKIRTRDLLITNQLLYQLS